MAPTSAKITEFSQNLTTFVHQFPQLCLHLCLPCFVRSQTVSIFFSPSATGLCFCFNGSKFGGVGFDFLIEQDNFCLGASMPLTRCSNLFLQDLKTTFIILCLLTNCRKLLTVGVEFSVQRRFFEGHVFDGGTKRFAGSCIAECFRQLSSACGNLVFEFVHTSNQPFSPVFRLLCCSLGLSQFDLHRTKLSVHFFE